MSTVQHLEFTLSTLVPRSPTYHCLVPSRTLSPTKKLLETEEDEEGDGQQAIDVFVPEKRMRYSCPRQFIGHAGYGEKMVVCSAYSCAIEAGQAPSEITACAMGNQCRFVHIDVPLTQLKGDIIHVHYIYREAALCPYERLSTAMAREQPTIATKGMAIQVASPSGEEGELQSIPWTDIIVTEGAREALKANKRTQPCHCAHYYYAQTCNRGASCSFIHVVSTDPSQERGSTRPSTYRKRMRQLGLEIPIDSFRFNASPISSILKASNCTSPSTYSIRSVSTAQDKYEAESAFEDCFHYPYSRQNSFVSVGLSASLKSFSVKSASPCPSSVFLPKDSDDSFITLRTASTVIVELEAAQPTVPKDRYVHNPYQGATMAVAEGCN